MHSFSLSLSLSLSPFHVLNGERELTGGGEEAQGCKKGGIGRAADGFARLFVSGDVK